MYEDPVVPEQAATVTEKLGEYLISVGYWEATELGKDNLWHQLKHI